MTDGCLLNHLNAAPSQESGTTPFNGGRVAGFCKPCPVVAKDQGTPSLLQYLQLLSTFTFFRDRTAARPGFRLLNRLHIRLLLINQRRQVDCGHLGVTMMNVMMNRGVENRLAVDQLKHRSQRPG